MKLASDKRIFAGVDLADFIGRASDLDRLFRHARGEGRETGLALLAEPAAGCSELLRQVYDVLFADQNEIVPFYFELRRSDVSAVSAARRFLYEFLLQSIAFRRGDSRIIDASPAPAELAEISIPEDAAWIDRLIEIDRHAQDDDDAEVYIKACLAAPLRAAGHGVRAMVMVDGIHNAVLIDNGDSLIEALRGTFTAADIPFVLAGHRRYLFGKMPFSVMRLERLSFAAAGELVERLAENAEVEINDQTRDLIAVQLRGDPSYITEFFRAPSAGQSSLTSFKNVEQAYTDQIFGGHISRRLDAIFATAFTEADRELSAVAELADAVRSESGKLADIPYRRPGMEVLHIREIVNATPTAAVVDKTHLVLADYLDARANLASGNETRASVVGRAVLENVRRAPRVMARFYRQSAAIDLRALIAQFDGQEISTVLLNYARFKEGLKGGGDDEKALAILTSDAEKIALPRIVYSAHTAAYYPELEKLCEIERSAVGVGFADATDKGPMAWIAAEIDSKLEATRDLAEFWCDRLEMVAVNCDFKDFRLWLIAPEGFSEDAAALLDARNAYGSSGRQARMLARMLTGRAAETGAPDEYELAVPMGDETEMIAARAVEEIARRYKFTPKAINQIKTAVIEACINAAEHSFSPDRRIYQKLSFDGNAITITISNRGVRLGDTYIEDKAADNGRRGWGIKLIKGLMDDVRIERTDDGTRITMVKVLRRDDDG